ncbi:PorP/SprF family type IX secretion system membrane protein [Jejuia pallidilutea]|nr:PorP/SprF family type IX secretion system membrane protein [Jejuia pallidilutea]
MNKYLLYMFITLCTIQQFHSQESNGVVALALPVRNSLKFNRYAINPTFSFVREQNKYISFTNKKQWTQFNDAPNSYLFSYAGRFSENIGAGIGLFQQDFGVLTTFGGMLNFAYNASLTRESNLTFALNVGAYQSGLNEGRVVINTPDPALQNVPSNFLITINPGINYGTDFFDFGLAINNLVSYNLNDSKIIEDNPEQALQAHIMYTGYMDARGFFDESKFSTLIRSEFKKNQTVISGIAMLNVPKGIWAQAGYNTLYGASAGIGINVTNNIAVEYNYEQSMGNFSDFGSSHEITLAYRFNKKYRYSYGDDDEEQSVFNSNKRKRKPNNLTDEDRARIAERRAEIAARRKAEAEAKKAELANIPRKTSDSEKDKLEAASNIESKPVEKESVVTVNKEELLSKLNSEKEAELKAAEASRLQKEAEEKRQIELERQMVAAEAKAKAEQEARLQREAEQQAEVERERLAAEAKAKAAEVLRLQKEAEEKRQIEVESQRVAAEAKAKAELEARLQREAEQQAEAERERLAAEAKAKAAEVLRLQKEANIKQAEETIKSANATEVAVAETNTKQQQIPQATDEASKDMNALVNATSGTKETQEVLMKQLSEKIAAKQKDLDDLKEENDLSEQGIYLDPKPFKSLTAENQALETLKDEIDKTLEEQKVKIIELETIYLKRKKKIKDKEDPVNAFYLETLERLKSEQAQIITAKRDLIMNLEQIKEATDFERKRRIRRAAYDNQQDRFNKDKAALARIKKFTDESPVQLQEDDFDFGEEQTKNIQIIKNVLNEEPGYYIVIAVHNSVEKRDEFVTKVVASGEKNVNFFFDVKTNKYFIYYEKFNAISEAKNALEEKGSKPYNGKMSLVKIDN